MIALLRLFVSNVHRRIVEWRTRSTDDYVDLASILRQIGEL